MTARPALRRLMAAIAGCAVVLGSYQSGRRSLPRPTTVYVTPRGNRYHLPGCRYLRAGGIPTPVGAARDGRYRACAACGPPAMGGTP